MPLKRNMTSKWVPVSAPAGYHLELDIGNSAGRLRHRPSDEMTWRAGHVDGAQHPLAKVDFHQVQTRWSVSRYGSALPIEEGDLQNLFDPSPVPKASSPLVLT